MTVRPFPYNISTVHNKDLKFIKGKVKYPNHLGYTGYWIKTRKSILYIDPKRRDIHDEEHDVEFEPEIDNFVGETDVASALYSPIIDHEGNVQGVIQLVNFIDGHRSIEPPQIRELECTCEVIGSAIKNLGEIISIMVLSTRLYDWVGRISEIAMKELENLGGISETEITSKD